MAILGGPKRAACGCAAAGASGFSRCSPFETLGRRQEGALAAPGAAELQCGERVAPRERLIACLLRRMDSCPRVQMEPVAKTSRIRIKCRIGSARRRRGKRGHSRGRERPDGCSVGAATWKMLAALQRVACFACRRDFARVSAVTVTLAGAKRRAVLPACWAGCCVEVVIAVLLRGGQTGKVEVGCQRA